jgi:hypothetical protein
VTTRRRQPLPRLLPDYPGRRPIYDSWERVLLVMAQDLTVGEWAKQIGCHKRTIERMCQRLGVHTRDSREVRAMWRQRVQLWRQHNPFVR